MVRMVVFDVGETLVDETRHWSEWADWLGVSRFTFLAALGAVIASGRHHRDVFRITIGHDYRDLVEQRTRSGWRYEIRPADFYPDALPCLAVLRARGFRIGIAGNQPQACEQCLRDLGLDLDLLGSSEAWGVAKPSPEFFHRLIAEAGLSACDVCYVGDHPENDIRPAKRAGLGTIFIRRGPWGLIHADSAAAREADRQVAGLAELATILPLL